MKKKILLALFTLFLAYGTLNSRVVIKKVGPDNRTEEQKEKQWQQEKKTLPILFIALVGMIVIAQIKKR